MDQKAGTGPLHVLWTGCPLAQCSTQTVLPKLTYVTLSHWPAPHAGMPLHATLGDIRKVAGQRSSVLRRRNRANSAFLAHAVYVISEVCAAFVFTVPSVITFHIVCGGASGHADALQSNLRLSKCSLAITVGISSAAFWNL